MTISVGVQEYPAADDMSREGDPIISHDVEMISAVCQQARILQECMFRYSVGLQHAVYLERASGPRRHVLLVVTAAG
jgi:hypothetical protein